MLHASSTLVYKALSFCKLESKLLPTKFKDDEDRFLITKSYTNKISHLDF